MFWCMADVGLVKNWAHFGHIYVTYITYFQIFMCILSNIYVHILVSFKFMFGGCVGPVV